MCTVVLLLLLQASLLARGTARRSTSPLTCAAAAAGHFGGAWYRQKIDFSAFPGAVLATTNCVLDPPKAYKNRLFTTNEVS
jgi:hydroxylamine reductase (hybrid-cluster protein)